MNKIELFQTQLKKYKINAYLVFSSDFHGSEYLSNYFKSRAYLSDFTGSAGTLLILQDQAYLWTDGRYYLQAQKQLEGSSIALMKEGEEKTPSIAEFLNSVLHDQDTLAFDGRTASTKFVLELKQKIKADIQWITNMDLIENVWPERPKLPFSILYKLEPFFTGKTYLDKLKAIHSEMKQKNIDIFLISSLEDQAWLYNLRGNDIPHTPVFLSYTIITFEHTTLFIDPTKIDLTIERYLNDMDISVRSYFEIYDVVKTFKAKQILFDSSKVNYQLYTSLHNTNTLIDEPDMTVLMKAIKTPEEIKNLRLAHIKDGVAVTKFMYQLKTEYKNQKDLSEISLQEDLDNLRKNTPGFIDLSFDTICAFKEHGAMMHYQATSESNSSIKDDGFLLVDSGGHYLEGTTDITRTFALGTITNEMKLHFTTVLKSMIALSTAVFLEGLHGYNLDILARGPIWKLLLDYKCGTGHGVGYLLSVHEAPNGFRYKLVPERNDSCILRSGMVTTNEPGIYLENKYGIRIENELLCVEKAENEYGNFLSFETLTLAPIDLDAIEPSLLSQEEIDWLNDYHTQVYETLSPYLTDDENKWLKEYTNKIEK